MIEIINRNLFTSTCQTLVNTVNCKGVMGKGLALEFRLRFPFMFKEYERQCEASNIAIGRPWLYHDDDLLSSSPWILNFPTKDHWKYPSKEAYLHQGLSWFVENNRNLGIQSIAFPLLGAENGGLSVECSLAIMREHLSRLDIPVHIHRYNPAWADDLHPILRRLSRAGVDVGAQAGLTGGQWASIESAIEKTNTIGQLSACKGVGDRSLEKLIRYLYSDRARQCPVGITIEVSEQTKPWNLDNLAPTLESLRVPHVANGGLPIRIRYVSDRAMGIIALGKKCWRVPPTDQALDAIRRELGGATVSVELAGD